MKWIENLLEGYTAGELTIRLLLFSAFILIIILPIVHKIETSRKLNQIEKNKNEDNYNQELILQEIRKMKEDIQEIKNKIEKEEREK